MKSALIVLMTFASLWSVNAFSKETLSFYYETAKENCHDIASIRVEMDRINNEILQLLTERTAYVKRAGDLKSQTTRIADDRQRVADQEKKVIEKSIQLELPLEISVPAFRSIMDTSIKFQQGYIDHQLLK
jgi:chorismate mutase